MRTLLLLAAAMAAAAAAEAAAPCPLDPEKDLKPLATLGLTKEKIDGLDAGAAADLCKARAIVHGRPQGAPDEPEKYMTEAELKRHAATLAAELTKEARRVFGAG